MNHWGYNTTYGNVQEENENWWNEFRTMALEDIATGILDKIIYDLAAEETVALLENDKPPAWMREYFISYAANEWAGSTVRLLIVLFIWLHYRQEEHGIAGEYGFLFNTAPYKRNLREVYTYAKEHHSDAPFNWIARLLITAIQRGWRRFPRPEWLDTTIGHTQQNTARNGSGAPPAEQQEITNKVWQAFRELSAGRTVSDMTLRSVINQVGYHRMSAATPDAIGFINRDIFAAYINTTNKS